jgi:hypothetical protein
MAKSASAELSEQIRAYDLCWVEGRPGDVRAFLHPDVVFTGPNFERLVRGADACAQSYVGFLSQAKVHGFTASDYVIDVIEGTAVMTYRWTIDYELNGARSVETGQDLLVWVREGDRWLVGWRSQRPDPAAA